MLTKARTFTFQIDPAIREALEKEAHEKDRSVAWLINHYLRRVLEAAQRLPPKSDEQ